MSKRRPDRLRMRAQRGVALMVALVMLVIIGFTSVAVMRGALVADVVANNTRTQNFALQAAQVALSYCERQIDAKTKDPNYQLKDQPAAGDPMLWESFSSWHGANVQALTVPDGVLRADISSISADAKRPQCLVQRMPAPGAGGGTWYVVTSRGFSLDYAEDDVGNATSGSAVWLQSTLLAK